MLIRTHLAITLFFVLLLITSVTSLSGKIIFVIVALIATFIPDVDSRFSTVGRRKIARVLQWFTKHRGITHSFTFLLAITLILVLFFPVISLGFFLGYGLHLLSDAFTIDGIRPLYPLKRKTKGSLRTGGKIEVSLLAIFIVLDILMFFFRIFNGF